MALEELKAIIEFNRAQPDADAEDIENNLCPDCAWPLDINSRGEKACLICGEVYR